MKLPQEFSERMKILLGDEYKEFLETYEEPRRYGLRINTLKIGAQEFERIAPFPVERLPWIPGGYWYEKCGTASRHPFYYAGLYYLQEPSAMTPASVLPVEPGDRVLDLCAAPGGKATALAEKLKGKGLLVANDISASRAKALLKNLEVFGVTNAFVTNAAPAKLESQFPQFFDKILVDAPCSGEGMFRKDAANAKAWSLEKVKTCAKAQKGILRSAAAMLRPGGMMLYSTCTFAPEEDEQAAAYLLREFPEMELCDIPWYEGFSHGRPELGRESWQEELRAADIFGRRKTKNDRGDTAYAAENEQDCSGEEINVQRSRGSEREETLRDIRDKEDRILAQLGKCVRIFPHKMCGEGHFLALFRKRETFEDVSGCAARQVPSGDRGSRICGTGAEDERVEARGSRIRGTGAEDERVEARGSRICGTGAEDERVEAGGSRICGTGAEDERIEARGSRNCATGAENGRSRRSGAGTEEMSLRNKNRNGRRQNKDSLRGGLMKKSSSEAEMEILREFLRDVRLDFQKERIEVRNGQAYLIPEALPKVQGIPFLRNGLYLGEIRKDRFEPSQSLAMTLRGDGYASVIRLLADDERVYRYLRGETIEVDDIMPDRAGGWQLVCADGYPLGWGKLVNGVLKNKYHSGWRM